MDPSDLRRIKPQLASQDNNKWSSQQDSLQRWPPHRDARHDKGMPNHSTESGKSAAHSFGNVVTVWSTGKDPRKALTTSSWSAQHFWQTTMARKMRGA
jgi:hypothetical protein